MSKENYKIVASCITEPARSDIINGLWMKKMSIGRLKDEGDLDSVGFYRSWVNDIDALIRDIRKIPEC